jgi:spermidine synthase
MRRIYLFFFISGATALLYEIIWVRLLGLVFGNTTHAISAVLTAYMAGLGAGSFWVGRRADRWRQPLKAYGLLEISIGLYAALTLPLLSLIQTLYVGFAQKFDPSLAGLTAVRLALSFIVLFVPTFMMGATLPVLAKLFIRSRARIGSGTALLYGVNTAGAVLGTVLTGFLLLETLGTQSTLMLAVVLNIGIGLLACLYAGESATLQQVPKESPMQETPTNSVRETAPLVRWIPLGLLISGAIAMLYEISWTRMLTLLTGSSTYAFTITLSTFLLGLALGSALYQSVLRKRPARILEWGWLQLTIALFSLLTLSLFDQVGIVMVRLYALTIGSPGWLEVMRFVLCLGFILIPTLCFGALFPVSVSLYARSETT